MTKHKLQQIITQAKNTKQPYPITFQQLKDAGVEMYEIHLATYCNTYKGSFGEWSETPPAGYSPLIVSDIFSREEASNAIKRHQKGFTSFIELLDELAKAGVSHYRVCMIDRTVSYYDKAEENSFQERVP